jgi:hypothetical protein
MATNYDPKNITPDIAELLNRKGVMPEYLNGLSANLKKDLPYTATGATQLEGIAGLPLRDGLGAITTGSVDDKGNTTGRSVMLVNTSPQNPFPIKDTLAHEMEHALEFQGASRQGESINSLWDSMVNQNTSGNRLDVAKRIIEHAPYLQKNWGLDPASINDGYFSKKAIDKYGNRVQNLLNEHFATLSALEQNNNKRLTDDPYVRENILTTPNQRAAYNALTGLRQSRLDAKDLPPYTMQPDKNDPTMTEKVKKMLGLAKGGTTDKPLQGNQKLI